MRRKPSAARKSSKPSAARRHQRSATDEGSSGSSFSPGSDDSDASYDEPPTPATAKRRRGKGSNLGEPWTHAENNLLFKLAREAGRKPPGEAHDSFAEIAKELAKADFPARSVRAVKIQYNRLRRAAGEKGSDTDEDKSFADPTRRPFTKDEVDYLFELLPQTGVKWTELPVGRLFTSNIGRCVTRATKMSSSGTPASRSPSASKSSTTSSS